MCIQIQIKSLIALERDLASSPYRSTAVLGKTCKSTLWNMFREAATYHRHSCLQECDREE